ncbi:hypothetical protein FNV43_RR25076 [Rhamnella rubrinervis]|uniref:LRAT domain-containing protein n=1 Tax=Rhamnella rubrinervis TaxID=2594499 RepID=A0A8K0DRS8_9ROSA|nr:hypothetical protein FNV43_RR25076 [Rhamnella rubrinervis]
MVWLSNKIGRDDLNPGDHIYTWRRGYYYSHHGIYGHDGRVIHLTRGPGRDGFSSSSSHPSDGPVLSSTLEEFLSGRGLRRFQYGVNAIKFLIKRAGTCTLAFSDPPEDVLRRASFLLTYGSGDYDLSNNNCEDFALYCRTELLDLKGTRKTGKSGQIASFVAAITTIFAYIIMPHGFLPTGFTGLSLMYWYFNYSIRLHFDAVSRVSYVLERVEVEEFRQLSCTESKSALYWYKFDSHPSYIGSHSLVFYSREHNSSMD